MYDKGFLLEIDKAIKLPYTPIFECTITTIKGNLYNTHSTVIIIYNSRDEKVEGVIDLVCLSEETAKGSANAQGSNQTKKYKIE